MVVNSFLSFYRNSRNWFAPFVCLPQQSKRTVVPQRYRDYTNDGHSIELLLILS